MATLYGRSLVSFKVVELKDELTKRGLHLSGKKQDLVERLEQYILEHEIEDVDAVPRQDSNPGQSGRSSDEEIPPTVQIDTNLEENDIIKEYMMMRQSQFKSAIEEVKQHKAVEKPSAGQTDKKKEPFTGNIDSDDEDAPLKQKKSPKKQKDRHTSASESEGEISRSSQH